MKNKPYLTGISLTNYEKRVLIAESKRRGLFNLSATLRQIIREWVEWSDQTYPLEEERVQITEAGRQALDVQEGDGHEPE